MRFYIIAGYLFTAVFGTLSHFLYDCSGQNLFIALFAPVNESIWEHMKLSFFPVLLYAFFLSYIRQPEKEFHTLRDALLLGNFVGTFSIPVLFYTYSGILGRHLLAVDIAVFLLGLFFAFRFAWKGKDTVRTDSRRKWIYLLTALLALLFFIFTFYPPRIGLFLDLS